MRGDQRGSMVIETVLYMGFSLVILCQVANLGAWVITRDVAHSAVDQGVRAGARADVDGTAACQERMGQVLGNLATGSGASASCSDDGETVTARLSMPLRSWLPGEPDGHTSVAALARKEGIR